MSNSINRFLDALEGNELLEAKEQLHTALAEKVSAKMEARKIELAGNISEDALDEMLAKDYSGMVGKFRKAVDKAEEAQKKGNIKKMEQYLDDARNRLFGMKSSDYSKLKATDHQERYYKMKGMDMDEELKKDADDPCWGGYVQLGTKKKNGKEVPNCVPMESVNESTTVEVSVRDARKANDIAKDMFRGEYKMDGSNSFVFKKAGAASDFRAELSKQGVEVE